MIYLAPDQDRHLRSLAYAAGVSDTEIVRRAVEAYWDREFVQMRADAQRTRGFIDAHPEGWPDEPSEWFEG